MKVSNSTQFNNSSLLAQNKKVSFGAGRASVIESIGNAVKKDGFLSKFNKHVEFNDGYDLPYSVFLAVLFGAVLGCRALFARDNEERREILTRDSITVGTLIFARPPLKKAFATLSKNRSGLALTIKPAEHKASNMFKKAMDYLKPNSGIKVMTSSDIVTKYSVQGYKNGFADVINFIQKEDGNFEKILKKNANFKESVKKAYDSLNPKVKFEEAKTADFIETFTKGHKATHTKELDEFYNLMNGKDNPLVKKAKSINSSFDFVTTFLIVPAMLGIALPKLLEKQMKDSRKAAAAQEAQDAMQAVKIANPSLFMGLSNSQAFKSFETISK